MTSEKTNMSNLFDRIDLMISKLNNIELEISELENSRKEVLDNKIMDIEQTAKYLYCSKHSIYKMVEKALIPHYKKSRKLYFDVDDINNWLKSGKKITKSEMEENAMNNVINRRFAQKNMRN